MSRTMLDCTGINASTLHARFPDQALIACYVTGSNDIIWTTGERALWPDAEYVTIDQYNGSPPVTTAIVRDVEPSAWPANHAVITSTWSTAVARPTIYCDQTDLTSVIAEGWKGDLWLAIPGWTEGDALPDHGEATVVAVQNAEDVDNLYDSSIVLDNYWPRLAPAVTEDTMLNLQIADQAYVPFPAGSFKTLTIYRDFQACGARIAVHSASKGYSQIWDGTVASAKPETITFTESDVNAVSVSGIKGGPVGVTLA